MKEILPKVSCICPTYNRVSRCPLALNECLYWFLAQDYDGPKELIILNDAPGQVLTLAIPSSSVKVVNVNSRFSSLGEKYNQLVRMSSGEIILPWEDDDISLPGRITQAVEQLKHFSYWNPKGAFFQVGPKNGLQLCSPHSVHHNASAYWKTVWSKVGGYRTDGYSGFRQDMYFDQDVRQHRFCQVNDGFVKPEEMTYVYRWQAIPGCPNLSGHSDPKVGWDKEPLPIPGAFVVRPEIGRDYQKEAEFLYSSTT